VYTYTQSLLYALVGFLKKVGVNKNDIPIRNREVSLIERSQPEDIEPKMREHKLISVNWEGALKQKGVQQELGVFVIYVIPSK
jgi:hypothetical protein